VGTVLPHSIDAQEGGFVDEETRRRREEASSRRRWMTSRGFQSSVEGEGRRRGLQLKAQAGGIADDRSCFANPDPRRRYRDEDRRRFLDPDGFAEVGDPATFGATRGPGRAVKLGERVYEGVRYD